jgi:Protein of unknown function (DUF2505)
VSTRIAHRATWDVPAEEVYAELVDGDHLRARLEELGGKDPALVEHSVDASGARLELRHSVPVEFLPTAVRRFTGDDLVLDRVETWRVRQDGGYDGTFEVTVRGLPGTMTGTQELTDSGGGAVTEIQGEATVSVPVVGGRIEKVVVEQVGALLDAEDAFTRRRLEKR